MEQVGFGGSCHWCTEAIFASLKGVMAVEQGWIASRGSTAGFSEAVAVTFDPAKISLDVLITIHLYTHSCTADHAMRAKYRSAVYTLNEAQQQIAQGAITALQAGFDRPIITQVIPLDTFKLNQEKYLNYYYNDPHKPFCENIIKPKLKLLLQKFKHEVDADKFHHQ